MLFRNDCIRLTPTQSILFNTLIANKTIGTSIVLDSGAFNHITCNLKNIVQHTIVWGQFGVIVGVGGKKINITGMGVQSEDWTTNRNNRVTVPTLVLYAPACGYNLRSTREYAKQGWTISTTEETEGVRTKMHHPSLPTGEHITCAPLSGLDTLPVTRTHNDTKFTVKELQGRNRPQLVTEPMAPYERKKALATIGSAEANTTAEGSTRPPPKAQQKHALRGAYPLRSVKADLDVITRGQNIIVKQLQAEIKASPRMFILQAKHGPLPNARTAMLQLRFGGATARSMSTLVRRWVGTDRKHIPVSLRFTSADEQYLQSAITSVAGGKAMRRIQLPPHHPPMLRWQHLAMDCLSGKFIPSKRRNQYAHVIIDLFTGDPFVSVHPEQSSVAMLHSVKEYARERNAPWNMASTCLNNDVTIHCDGHPTYTGGPFKHELTDTHGMKIHVCAPGIHQANYMAALDQVHSSLSIKLRANLKIAAPMFARHGLDPLEFWCYAIQQAELQKRLTPLHKLDGKSYIEEEWGRLLDEDEIIRLLPAHWGCHCHFLAISTQPKRAVVGDHNTDTKPNKTLQAKRHEAIYLGTGRDGVYLLWDIQARKQRRSIDVQFTQQDQTVLAPYRALLELAGTTDDTVDQVDWWEFNKQCMPKRLGMQGTAIQLNPNKGVCPDPHTLPQLGQTPPPPPASPPKAQSVRAALLATHKCITQVEQESHTDKRQTPLSANNPVLKGSHHVMLADAEMQGAFITALDLDPDCPVEPMLDALLSRKQWADATTSAPMRSSDAEALMLQHVNTHTADSDLTALRHEVLSLHEQGAYGPGSDDDREPEFQMLAASDDQQYLLMADSVAHRQITARRKAGDHSIKHPMEKDHFFVIRKTDLENLADRKRKNDIRASSAVELSDWSQLKWIRKQDNLPLPKSLQKAKDSEYGPWWELAMQRELDSFEPTIVYDEVPISQVPKDAQGRRCILRMLVTISRKYDSEGNLSRLKCRLCVDGSQQPEHLVGDTYSSVPATGVVRLADAVGVEMGYSAYSADLTTCFLKGRIPHDLVGRIYCRLPPAMEKRCPKTNEPIVWALKAGCYGLKQSANLWETELVSWLMSPPGKASIDRQPVDKQKPGAKYTSLTPDIRQPLRGGCPLPFKRCEQDAKLFILDEHKLEHDQRYSDTKQELYRQHPEGPIDPYTQKPTTWKYYFLIHVDDSKVYTSCDTLNRIMMHGVSHIAGYKGKWKVTGGDENLNSAAAAPADFLSVTIRYTPGVKSEWSQPSYIPKLLRKHGYDPATLNTVSTPMVPRTAKLILKSRCPQTEEAKKREFTELVRHKLVSTNCKNYHAATTEYRSQVASCNFLAVTTMPGIAFAVSKMASIQAAPTEYGFRAIKHLMRFLAGQQNHALIYRRNNNGKVILQAESDASLGDDEDTGDTQISWACRIGGNNAAYFDWCSKRSTVILLSTFSAELWAVSEACRQVMGYKMILESMGHPQPQVAIYSDSSSAVANCQHRLNSSRNRSVRLRAWYARTCQEEKEVQIIHRPGAELTCDCLTKPISNQTLFKEQWASMMGHTRSSAT